MKEVQIKVQPSNSAKQREHKKRVHQTAQHAANHQAAEDRIDGAEGGTAFRSNAGSFHEKALDPGVCWLAMGQSIGIDFQSTPTKSF
jgi:hypothetical protein